MSRVHTKESRVLVNETSASCDLTGYTVTHQRNLSETTTLCDSGSTFIPGPLNGALGLKGLFDPSAGSFYTEALACLGVDNGYLVSVAPAGFALGYPTFITVSDLQDFAVDASVDAAVTAVVSAMPDNGVDWGVSLHDLAAVTADADGSSVDNAAATAGGAVASLHVTAFTGFTGVVIKIQHSTNNSVWSDLITFTTVAGTTSEYKTVTGTINRYLRASWDVTGTGSITFACAAARR